MGGENADFILLRVAEADPRGRHTPLKWGQFTSASYIDLTSDCYQSAGR